MNDALAIVWSPLLPWPLLAALLAAALLLCGFAVFRRAGGVWWRALGFAVLLLAIANPALLVEERDPRDDIVLVVTDESESQDIQERPQQRAAISEALRQELSKLPRTEVRSIVAGAQQLGEADGGTKLFGAIQSALSDSGRERVGAVFLISDGQVEDAPERLEELGIDAPLHLLLTGQKREFDRRVVLEQVPSFGIVGNELLMTLRVDDLPNAPDGTRAEVTIRIDGKQYLRLPVPVGESREVAFELDHRGPTVLEVEVEDAGNELSLRNNIVATEISGVRDRLRVLLVSGEPHAGERAWRNILKSDPSVDLVHFTILRPPEKQDGTPISELSLIAFPTRELFEVKLDEFDLVIFDRYRRRGVLPVLYLENIAAYVENGGALFEAVGPTFATPLSLHRTPLGRVLPGAPTGRVIEGGFIPSVTEVGHRHPVTAALPGAEAPSGAAAWGRWFRHVETAAEQGEVVMNGAENLPLLILNRVGEGRVAQLMSDQIWLWSRGFEGGGPQAELIRRVAHWLMKEPELEEENLRARVEGDRLQVRRRSLDPELPQIEVTSPSGDIRRLALEPGERGIGTASMAIEEPGLYRVSDGERIALAAAGALNPKEFQDLRATGERLAALLAESGGAAVRFAETGLPEIRKVRADRDRSASGWLGVAEQESYLVTGITRTPVMPALVALLLALGALFLAWRREGR